MFNTCFCNKQMAQYLTKNKVCRDYNLACGVSIRATCCKAKLKKTGLSQIFNQDLYDSCKHLHVYLLNACPLVCSGLSCALRQDIARLISTFQINPCPTHYLFVFGNQPRDNDINMHPLICHYFVNLSSTVLG